MNIVQKKLKFRHLEFWTFYMFVPTIGPVISVLLLPNTIEENYMHIMCNFVNKCLNILQVQNRINPEVLL